MFYISSCSSDGIEADNSKKFLFTQIRFGDGDFVRLVGRRRRRNVGRCRGFAVRIPVPIENMIIVRVQKEVFFTLANVLKVKIDLSVGK